ncbi:hypothetical protein P8452_62096 [Trifolium repens]|nr:hypothetical protein P8452_62096 [Trifolium repens]
MVKSPSQTPPPSPPPSPQPQPPQFHHLQSATDIIRLMTKDLPRPISPLHSSYLELSEESPPAVTVHSPPPSPPSSQQLPPPQSLLHPSQSATDIVRLMTEDLPPPISPSHSSYLELSEESLPEVTVHSPPPSPQQLPLPENWSTEEERLFEQGTKACGKDWELISADYVKTKTPIQISEYAKKMLM